MVQSPSTYLMLKVLGFTTTDIVIGLTFKGSDQQILFTKGRQMKMNN